MNYTKKQLEKIYVDCVCEELKNPELLRIKDALYAVCSNANFVANELEQLIEILNELPDDKLKLIDDKFIKLAKEIDENMDLKNTRWMYPLNLIIDTLFSRHFEQAKCLYNTSLGFWGMPLFYDTKMSVVDELSHYNYDFSQTLKSCSPFLRDRPMCGFYEHSKYSMNQCTVIYDIFDRMFLMFLSNIENYEKDYSLPNKIMIYMMNNFNQIMEILDYFYEGNMKRATDNTKLNALAKILLDEFHGKDKVISPEEDEIIQYIKKKKINPKSGVVDIERLNS